MNDEGHASRERPFQFHTIGCGEFGAFFWIHLYSVREERDQLDGECFQGLVTHSIVEPNVTFEHTFLSATGTINTSKGEEQLFHFVVSFVIHCSADVDVTAFDQGSVVHEEFIGCFIFSV